MKPQSQKIASSGSRRLASLLMLELEDCRWSRGLEKYLGDGQPAGVLLGGSRLPTPEVTAEFLARVANALDDPPILALRESDGSLSPLRRFLPATPSPRTAARNGPGEARKLGDLIGSALRLIGFNTTLAPSLDLSAPYSDLSLDDRIFSSDPETVARCGGAFIQGLERQGILAAPGHFPGISDATLDGVSKTYVGYKTMAEMWREDLLPFRRLLPRSRLVVVSHLPYKAYDIYLERPACTSANVLQGLLREKLGFRGCDVADFGHASNLARDAKVMDPVLKFEGPLTFAAYAESLAAGCDLLVVRPDLTARDVVQELARGADSGALAPRRLDEAARRVRTAKRGLRRPSGRLNVKAFDKLALEIEDFARTCK